MGGGEGRSLSPTLPACTLGITDDGVREGGGCGEVAWESDLSSSKNACMERERSGERRGGGEEKEGVESSGKRGR